MTTDRSRRVKGEGSVYQRADGTSTPYPPPCHPSCALGPGRDHPGYLGYRCIDENVRALPFPGESDSDHQQESKP